MGTWCYITPGTSTILPLSTEPEISVCLIAVLPRLGQSASFLSQSSERLELDEAIICCPKNKSVINPSSSRGTLLVGRGNDETLLACRAAGFAVHLVHTVMNMPHSRYLELTDLSSTAWSVSGFRLPCGCPRRWHRCRSV